MVEHKITAVIPLRLKEVRFISDLKRFKELLLPSFEKYWIDKDNLEFLVITPPEDQLIIKKSINNISNFKIKIVNDDKICPTLKKESGWYKQQILKLSVAKYVRTEYYITLDADIILHKPLRMCDLFIDGKAIFKKEEAFVHMDWWIASKKVLKSNYEIKEKDIVIAVTPEILHTNSCVKLLNEIALRNKVEDPYLFLFRICENLKWTEYTLYWLYLLELQQENELYSWENNQLYEGLWVDFDINSNKYATIKNIIERSEAFFIIIQSTLSIESKSIAIILFDKSKLYSIIKFYYSEMNFWGNTVMIRFVNKLEKIYSFLLPGKI